jgi:hypothetical protein
VLIAATGWSKQAEHQTDPRGAGKRRKCLHREVLAQPVSLAWSRSPETTQHLLLSKVA